MHFKLSPAQTKVYEFIQAFMKVHKFAPTYNEICEGLEFKSRASAFKHVKKLRAMGLVSVREGSARGIRVRSVIYSQGKN